MAKMAYYMDTKCNMTGPFCLTLSNILKASRASCTCCFVRGGIGKSLMIFLIFLQQWNKTGNAAEGEIVGPVAGVEVG